MTPTRCHYLEVALDSVVDDRLGEVVCGHEAVDSDVSYGRLEVRLLSVHHETNTTLLSTLDGKSGPDRYTSQ